jgi:predicted neutral ceramidase superfamily lipid hydrolase
MWDERSMKDPGETLGDKTRCRECKGKFISFITGRSREMKGNFRHIQEYTRKVDILERYR